MAENENTTPEAAPQEEAPQFAVQRIYLKDASLEMPNAPGDLLSSRSSSGRHPARRLRTWPGSARPLRSRCSCNCHSQDQNQ